MVSQRHEEPGAGPEQIAEAVTRLRGGGLVAFPTETVYGLGADALNPDAVALVFKVKGRPGFNPLIVHVSDEAMARTVAAEWPDDAATLAHAFWPGPLTIVVPRATSLPDIVTAGGPTVAVRCPDHHVTLSLLEAFGRPLVGPSANPSGAVSPTRAEHVRAAFTEDHVFVLDGGPCRAGIESTVVTLVPPAQGAGSAAPGPRILRAGVIGAEDIARILGRPVTEAISAGAPLQSPGQLEVHYAPKTRALLYRHEDLPRVLASTPGHTAILAIRARETPAGHALIRMPSDATHYAARLYAALREADNLGAALIAIEIPPTDGPIWRAIHDRLNRAARSF